MKKRLLIVDDNSNNLYMLKMVMEGNGFEVIAAENGKDALDKAQANPPDLIVSDILMPVMDGYTLCRECKLDERLRDMPFVFYTATYTEPKDEQFALSLGADRFIIKPQEPEILIKAVQEVISDKNALKLMAAKPLGEEMEFMREHHGILLNKLEKKMVDLEIANQQLKISEERYRLSFENASDIIYTIDTDRKFSSVSPSIERILGYKPEDFIGRHVSGVRHILTPSSFDRAKANIRLIFEGETIQAAIYEFVAMDGTIKVGEVTGSPIISQGRIIGMISVARDITVRTRLEKERKILEERLQRAEKMEAVGVLAGGVAHDLNNVLGILIGYSDLLLNVVEESSRIRPHVTNIMNASTRAAAIVQDLLTLARRGVQNKKVFNLNDSVRELLKTPEYEELTTLNPNMQITMDLEPKLLNIKGSPVHLSKTLINLVRNAMEAMAPNGLLKITTGNQYLDLPVSGYDHIKEGDYVVISVSDTGEGISEDDLKHIFEPFYTKKAMGRSGTGLGLAVVWGTVNDHDGYIDVESRTGKGTTFTLYFPVTRQEMAADKMAAPISEYMGKNESILIVDDMKGQRDLAAQILKKLNYRIAVAESGEAAVAYLKTNKADLIILDMIMPPGMDGLDTYKQILEIHPNQKAIIVSGFSETERVIQAQELGAGAYIRKPYVLSTLGLAMRKELDNI